MQVEISNIVDEQGFFLEADTFRVNLTYDRSLANELYTALPRDGHVVLTFRNDRAIHAAELISAHMNLDHVLHNATDRYTVQLHHTTGTVTLRNAYLSSIMYTGDLDLEMEVDFYFMCPEFHNFAANRTIEADPKLDWKEVGF